MEQAHPSLETMASWLSGRLEHDLVRKEIVTHLVRTCPKCSQLYEEVLRCQSEMGHWDELIAVQESLEAPELYETLAGLPFAEQLVRVEEDETLHQWGLCQLLLAKSMDSVFADPTKSFELAELATRITRFLGDAYDPHWVLDLRARALAHVANALRILGELCGAEAYFRSAEDCLATSLSGNTLVQAEILDFRSSLLRDQRRWEEALALCKEASELYETNGDRIGVARSLIQKARILCEVGQVVQAIELLRQVPSTLEPGVGLDLAALARFNLLCFLIQAGDLDEAESLLPEVRLGLPSSLEPLKAVHVVWAEGRLHSARGRLDEAEDAYKQAQSEFLDRQMAYDAALVSLDLAIVFAQQGRSSELKTLALESMAIFDSREIHREAMAALVMFQEACRDDLLTAELAQHLASFLRRERRLL